MLARCVFIWYSWGRTLVFSCYLAFATCLGFRSFLVLIFLFHGWLPKTNTWMGLQLRGWGLLRLCVALYFNLNLGSFFLYA